ncbi:MAG: hypothetical protein K2X27_14275 [Candidatus Obscuribacterales bacterium]|nr:hypothetical protein [Candidatus Obscuribacterales bacterium]
MSELYTNILSAVVLAIAAGTIVELWKQRHGLLSDEVGEEFRSLSWRVVIFLIFPFVVWMDLRASILATEFLGGWVKDWHYGLLWFSAIPRSLPSADLLLPALFAGVLVQFLLALCLVPSLFFRPHPFLASVITQTISLILASNLILDPLLGVAGAGSSRWQIAYASAPRDGLLLILALYLCASLLFLFAAKSKTIRIWLAELTSPALAEQLRIAISEAKFDRNNQYQCCRLAILFDKAGMKSNAAKELQHLSKIAEGSIYLPFLEGLLSYKKRHYKKSRRAFEAAASFRDLNETLRATFFSAAACAAYADEDTEGSLNLCDRALEFDDKSLVARMVKVDAYLRLGKKEEAGEEVLAAIQRGLDCDVEDKIPMDPELTLRQIFRYQKSEARNKELAKSEEAALVES